MTTEQWQQSQQVFGEATECQDDRLAAFLDQACAGDADVRREVESLLAAYNAGGNNFLQPAGYRRERDADVTAADSDALVGRVVGRYRIVARIAEGGMGTVYEALQDDPRRKVALKIMSRWFGSASMLRRFRNEAEILGRLRHPGIAQVFEAGVHELESGLRVPYFALEFIPQAEPITAYVNKHALSKRERLELFTRVCDAVHHGHQRGVIHRDLKPANVLVDIDGQPKVIDFGVARVTDSDVAATLQQSTVGQIVGTIQYMSPEQCDADPHEIDTRSDVYSLGVVLFELLTDELPYDVSKCSIHQATQTIRTQAPWRPSTRDRAHRGDIETVVLKALEKAREKRYASAEALARDVRCILDHEPISARPPTTWVKATRWIGRHPKSMTATACIIFAALFIQATILSTLWFLRGRPAALVVIANGHEARLVSFLGNILASWRTSDTGQFSFATPLIPRPPGVGGGRLLVLGYEDNQRSRGKSYLEAYAVDEGYRHLAWEGRIEPNDLPKKPSSGGPFVAEDFGVHAGLIADIFGDPGEEIVVLHQLLSRTHTCLRVYSMHGDVLNQLWMDAQINELYWMEGPRLLVCAGENGQYFLEQRGAPAGIRSHPAVVFAVRPERDPNARGNRSYLAQEPDEWAAADPHLRPVWYKCLQLRNATPEFRLSLRSQTAQARLDPNTAVCVSADLLTSDAESKLGANIEWVFDQSGKTVGTPELNDLYKRNHERFMPGDPNRFPEIDDWKWGELPPVLSQYRTSK